ncbi:MAG: hypothetical protein Kow006_18530 [Gammaproteobacteria bacterium]
MMHPVFGSLLVVLLMVGGLLSAEAQQAAPLDTVAAQRQQLDAAVRNRLVEVDREYQRKAAELKRERDAKRQQLHAKGPNVFGRDRLEGKIDSEYQAALSELQRERDKQKKEINALKTRASRELAATGRISSGTWKQISPSSPGGSQIATRSVPGSAVTSPLPPKMPEKRSPQAGNPLIQNPAILAGNGSQSFAGGSAAGGFRAPAGQSAGRPESGKASESKSRIIGSRLPTANNPLIARTPPADAGKPIGTGSPGGGFVPSANRDPVIASAPAGLGLSGAQAAGDLRDDAVKEKGAQLAEGAARQPVTAVVTEQENTEIRTGVVEPRTYVATYVPCPTPYKVEVVSKIPDNWTPSFKSINFTWAVPAVKVYNGRETMFCHYSADRSGNDLETSHFFVHQPSPPGHTCAAYRGGFRCRRKGPFIFDEGTVTLRPSQRARLRSGSSSPLVWWRADSRTAQYLEAVSPHKIHKVNHEPTPRECEALLSGATPARYPGDEVRQGDIFCYHHNGRYGRFRIIAERGRAPKTIVLHYTTWPSASDY